MTASFTVAEKTNPAILNLTKQEADQVAQVFGLRVLDWRRLSDAAAANWFTAILHQYGADSFYSALSRVRRLSGRERGFWLASIATVSPKHAHLMKAPPDWTDSELWVVAFGIFMLDELGKVLQQFEAAQMEAALSEQI